MNIYAKLNAARKQFHAIKLKKSGLNKFAGYEYFELGDFLIPAMDALAANDLCAVISFGTELATMRIIDVVEGPFIEITSPMSSAALKGCHEVQNLGAVQSYLRRYLWVAALEIVEHDAIDASAGKTEKKDDKAKIIHSPRKGIKPSEDRLPALRDVYMEMMGKYQAGDVIGAMEEVYALEDGDEVTFVIDQIKESRIRTDIDKARHAAAATV